MRCPSAIYAVPLAAFVCFFPGSLALSQATQEPRALEPDKLVERELAGGQTHSYQLTLAADQYLHLIVEQRGIDVVVVVFAPDGQKLAEVDSPNSTQGPEPVSLVTETAGNYRVEVRSLEKTAATGRYEVKIAELRAARSEDNRRIAAERIFAEGEQLRGQGTAEALRKSIEKYTQSLPHFRAVENRKGEAIALNNLGFVHSSLGEKQKALDYYHQALPLTRAAGERAEEAAALHNIGKIHYDLDEKQKAIEYYQQAIALWQAVGDRQGEARTLTSLGAAYGSLGEAQKALEHYLRALQLRRVVADRRGEAITLLNIGTTYRELGEYQQVLDHNQQALTLFRTVGFRLGEAVALNNLGTIYDYLGEKQRALDNYGQAITLYRTVGDREGEARTLSNIGLIYDFLGEKQKALDHYTQAIPIFRALGSRSGEAITLDNIGQTYAALGEPQKSLGYHQQALALKQAVGDRGGEALSRHNLGQVYRALGEQQKALDYYHQALQLWRAVGNRYWEPVALHGIARIERERGNLTAARTQMDVALEIIESLRAKVISQELRAAYLASKQNFYEFKIDLLMQQHQRQPAAGYETVALETSERARARSLLETLSEARADIRQGVDLTLLERERNLQQLLNSKEQLRMQLLNRKHTPEQAAAAEKELRELTTQYQELQTQIKTSNPRYAALTQPQPLTLAELQQQVLDADTLLLEYALGEEHSYLWAVSREAVTSFELPKRAEIEAAARGFYETLSVANGVSGTNAAALSRMLLSPVAAQLGKKRLLIVADGTLQYVPFAALPDPVAGGRWSVAGKNSTQPPATSHQPLIANHEIISLPSASSLAVLRRELTGRKPAAKALALFADPVFAADDARLQRAQVATTAPDANETRALEPPLTRALREAGVTDANLRIPRLPGTRREAAAITALVPTAERKQALDFEASRAVATSAELSQYRIIHFATHGLLNSQHPELSGIVLSLVDAQGQPQDGFLRMHEIYNLKLPAELIVLSACQTGLGKEVKGEGLVGLTRGFMYAGAARVLASLWKVDDRATAELMKHFYQGMVKDGLRPAAALRAAQVALWKQQRWQEPYYWAAFVLQGEWK